MVFLKPRCWCFLFQWCSRKDAGVFQEYANVEYQQWLPSDVVLSLVDVPVPSVWCCRWWRYLRCLRFRRGGCTCADFGVVRSLVPSVMLALVDVPAVVLSLVDVPALLWRWFGVDGIQTVGER